jgi:hypothetical protein
LPVLLCDIAVSLYQAICFRVWGISQVRRSAYIRFDRHKLAYLDPIQRLNCLYCSYANGAFAYFVEVASKTEKYWCPIQEAEPPPAAHRRYASFLAHGDAENLRARLARQRADLLQEDD